MNSTSEMPAVTVREVGPRDGLQMAKTVMPTEAKLRWIAALAQAGVRELEAASFVPPTAMPQMADAAEVVRAVRTAHPALHVVALAPNLRGARDAAAAGARSIVIPVSASEAHSRSNVRRARADQVAEVARIAAWARTLDPGRPRIEGGIATAFGCSLQGEHVPYKGTSASVTDLAGGQISLVIGSSTLLEPLAKTGKIKFIAATSERRFPLLPEVPAAGETSPGFDMTIFFGLMAPKGTPAAVLAALNGRIDKLLATPETRETLGKLGVVPAGGTPAAFRAKVDADYEARGAILRELDIKAD